MELCLKKKHIFFTYHNTSDKSFLVSPYSTVSTEVLYIVHDTRKFTNFATCAVPWQEWIGKRNCTNSSAFKEFQRVHMKRVYLD